ncbi:zinc phosphodiesterase ELAC protein 1-like [Saccostrea echinata]|uniref:zinc phosphodiesterase ELAC protein 1-like n=1 Tax=Saccostrea echinata TaxID=191078 RepID=UPI002A81D32F|nr:zinc phosphodiesterase ELAC protein 1-like [Saccostrea echinata]XP_061176254.1 zinc phosphodiesterase ELAC protein 1-like [Saccostrea echinata]
MSSSMMEITFLGTGSAYPSPSRGASCVILKMDDGSWMFDCGEGSQIQLQKSKVKAGKVNKIFISHLHGDHMFGLPGLLCTISGNNQRSEPLEIYGPVGLRKFIRTSLELSRTILGFAYLVHEMKVLPCQIPSEIQKWKVEESCDSLSLHPNERKGRLIQADQDNVWTLYSNDKISVKAVYLQHRIPSFGFCVHEASSPGKLDISRLTLQGVKPGPWCKEVKEGKVVTLPDGRKIDPADVVGPPKPGRKVIILGDTCNSSEIYTVGMDADVIIHEATLQNSLKDMALEKGHSTPEMAAEVAKDLNARLLVLTHFSQRYMPVSDEYEEEESVSILLKEAEEIMGAERVIAAEDFLSITVPIRQSPTKDKAEDSVPNLAIFKQSSALKRDHAENLENEKNFLRENGKECERTYTEESRVKRLKIEETT